MTTSTTPLIYIDLYQAPKGLISRAAARPQRWRWRAINGNNGRVLAASSEAYTNRGDALAAINQLFAPASNVYLRSSNGGNQLLRSTVQS